MLCQGPEGCEGKEDRASHRDQYFLIGGDILQTNNKIKPFHDFRLIRERRGIGFSGLARKLSDDYNTGVKLNKP